jgi:TetR/AcrR family transcriptional regulator, transcriptional repressor for nem operon
VSEKRTRDEIVAAADRLFYRKGYEHTSFADIADVVKISRGNFYFHFKSKDQILDAVIDQRLVDTQQMLNRWESEGKNPADRIRSFIDMLIANRADIKRYGCPVGTLCTEMAKLNHASHAEAGRLFRLFRSWLRTQFELLDQGHEADARAMHLLARSQGVATLANALRDEPFIRAEVQQMHAWLDACVGARAVTAASRQKSKTAKESHVRRSS